jgi:hypothetical protein
MKTLFNSTFLFILLIFFSCTGRTRVINEYYPNGMIKKETQIKDGVPNGIIKTYDERGRLTSTAEVANGLYEGWMIKYNPLNNKITAKAYYKNDQQNGPLTLYYASGELYREENYVDGRVDGTIKTYWADGKLQAEVDFNKGYPGIGLKEYDQEGNLVKQPKIMIEEINQLARSNAFKLKVYLSDHRTNVDFYLGDLVDGKYLDPKAVKIRNISGVATLQYNVMKQHRIVKQMGISARTPTKNNNSLLLYRTYNLSVSH